MKASTRRLLNYRNTKPSDYQRLPPIGELAWIGLTNYLWLAFQLFHFGLSSRWRIPFGVRRFSWFLHRSASWTTLLQNMRPTTGRTKNVVPTMFSVQLRAYISNGQHGSSEFLFVFLREPMLLFLVSNHLVWVLSFTLIYRISFLSKEDSLSYSHDCHHSWNTIVWRRHPESAHIGIFFSVKKTTLVFSG